jgi:hypothetical protein
MVTVLVTLAVPDAADAADAATLIAGAADSTALAVIDTTGVEGHLPLPGSTVMRGTIQVELTHLHSDQVDSPTETTAGAPPPTADHRTDLA